MISAVPDEQAGRVKASPAARKAAREKGIDVIDFGMGSPDIPTPKHVIDALCKAMGGGR